MGSLHRVMWESLLGGHIPEHAQFEVVVQEGKIVDRVFLDRFSSKSRRRVWTCSVCVIKIEDRNTSGHAFVFLQKF